MAKFTFLKDNTTNQDEFNRIFPEYEQPYVQAIEPQHDYQMIQHIMMPLESYSEGHLDMVKRQMALRVFDKLFEDNAFEFTTEQDINQASFTIICNYRR